MSDVSGASQKAHNDLVLSFLAVRRAIGGLGYFLPVALLIHGLFAPGGISGSLSLSYYTPMREIFVGTLCAQAVFLWSYEGFRPGKGEAISDKLTARVASVAVLLVALCPTSLTDKAPDPMASGQVAAAAAGDCTLLQCVLGEGLASILHVIAAGVFFAALAVYCLVLFVRGKVDGPEKAASNRIYRICGWTIVVSIGLIGLLFLTELDEALAGLRPVFWLEGVATFAFATSWSVKGDALRPLVRMMMRNA